MVERGLGMQNMMQERALAKSGELKQDSNVGGGQMVSADYILTDNFNGVVRAVRGNPSLQHNVGSLATEAAARTKAGATYNEGDVLRPKIANVKLFSKPADDAPRR